MTLLVSRSPVLAAVLALGVMVMTPGHALRASAQNGGEAPSPILVDNFESYAPDTFPDGWVFVTEGKSIKTYEEAREPGETVVVREDNGNRFVRFITEDEAQRYTQRNGTDFDWNIKQHPRLQWQWRAHRLPEGANERTRNDTGAAVYVTFGSDWLGRPKSIKYSYSSSLPVGTVVEYGPLKVIVVDSAREPGMGTWKTVQRNIVNDYQQVFGGDPPQRPVSITLWSDSDTTDGVAEVDFDDVRLLPTR
jgi:hypothetical protein